MVKKKKKCYWSGEGGWEMKRKGEGGREKSKRSVCIVSPYLTLWIDPTTLCKMESKETNFTIG